MEDNSVLNFFYDVPNGAYFYEAVKWAVDKGVTNGLSDTMFGPYESCTRAQIVTFLWRAAGSRAEGDEQLHGCSCERLLCEGCRLGR